MMQMNYRVLSFDKFNMSATIQFEGMEPFNYEIPVVNGALPTGAVWDFWIATLYQAFVRNRSADVASVTDTSAVEALVNPTPFAYETPVQQEFAQPTNSGLTQV